MKIHDGIGDRLTANRSETWERNNVSKIVTMTAAMYRMGLKNIGELTKLTDTGGFPRPEAFIGWDEKVFEVWLAGYLERTRPKSPSTLS